MTPLQTQSSVDIKCILLTVVGVIAVTWWNEITSTTNTFRNSLTNVSKCRMLNKGWRVERIRSTRLPLLLKVRVGIVGEGFCWRVEPPVNVCRRSFLSSFRQLTPSSFRSIPTLLLMIMFYHQSSSSVIVIRLLVLLRPVRTSCAYCPYAHIVLTGFYCHLAYRLNRDAQWAHLRPQRLVSSTSGIHLEGKVR